MYIIKIIYEQTKTKTIQKKKGYLALKSFFFPHKNFYWPRAIFRIMEKKFY